MLCICAASETESPPRPPEEDLFHVDHHHICHRTAHDWARACPKGPQCQHQTLPWNTHMQVPEPQELPFIFRPSILVKFLMSSTYSFTYTLVNIHDGGTNTLSRAPTVLITLIMAVGLPKQSLWVKSSGTVQRRMCVQWEPEWKYAPQANALTWITKTHINPEHISAEDSTRLTLHRRIMAQK